MIYLLMVLYVGAPSLMVEAAYADYAQCEAVARPMNDAKGIAVCQGIRIDDKK
jgi:hypothetical protein